MGKQKGVYQVLWERGLIDPNNLNQYSMDGQKDQFGVLQPHTSLKRRGIPAPNNGAKNGRSCGRTPNVIANWRGRA